MNGIFRRTEAKAKAERFDVAYFSFPYFYIISFIR